MTVTTINPNVPATHSPLLSAIVRNNFAAAANDINALWTAIGGGGSVVTSITAGIGLSGGTITNTGTIAIANSNPNTLAGYDNTGVFANISIGSGLSLVSGILFATGAGTVTAVSITPANGFAGGSSGGTTPALTISTTVSGIVKGNGTALLAATAGTDYSAGTAALTTGILKSTTSTGALTIAIAADFPTLNQDTTGTAANATNTAITNDVGTNASMFLTWVTANTGNLPQKVSSTKLSFNPSTGALSSTSFTGAGTGLTGTAASLTAGSVTTNANLTGPITSVGNATSIAAQTGTGTTFVMQASPTLTTPNIGVATGTSLTASGVLASGANSGTGGQLTLNGATSGSAVIRVAAMAGSGIVFQLPTSNGTNTFVLSTDGSGNTSWIANGTGGSPVTTKGDLYTYSTNITRLPVGADGTVLIADSTQTTGLKWGVVSGSGTVTTSGSPASGNLAKFSGATVVTNGDLSGDITTSGTLITTVAKIAGTTVSGTSGSGNVLFSTSPTMVTPTLGVASVTTINKVTITAPATGSTLTIADGKTLTMSNSLTFTGTDASSVAFGAGGTVAYTANNLSVFATTTSAQLAGVISDETGTGSLVFANTPTLVTPVIGAATGTSLQLSGLTASSAVATDASKNLISVANTGTGSNVLATSPTLVTPLLGIPASGILTNCTSLPISTGVSGLATGISTFLSTPSSANLGTALTDKTGTGVNVFATSPTLVTPVLGVATATSINKIAFTAPATGSTLTIADGKTATISNTLTFTGTDSSSVAFGAGGTVAYTNVATLSSLTSVGTLVNLNTNNAAPTSDGTAIGPTTNAFNAGYTTVLGDLVYLDSSTTWQKTDANTLLLYNGMLGIVLQGSITSGNPVSVALPGSFVYMSTAFPTLTIGGVVYMSETAGAITQTAPVTTDAATRVIGWAVHADKIFFNPSADYITHI